MAKKDNSWGVSQVWNKTLESRPERELTERDYLWASEIGGPMIDVFLKLKAVPYTNPPEIRSKRKFEAGNFMEWIVLQVLKRSGVLIASQERTEFQYPGLLKVTGKADAIAGGKINLDASLQELRALGLPEFFESAAEAILAYLAEKYPDGLKEMPIEVKSISMWVYEKYDKRGPNVNNLYQLFHYMKGGNYPLGNALYVCRDDLRMLEFPITNPGPIEDGYKGWIEQMSKYVAADEEPPLEQPIIYDDGRFSLNWKVEYSSYLTMLYDFKNAEQFQNIFMPKVRTWNYTLTRLRSGAKMTKNNQEALDQIKKEFPDIKFEEVADGQGDEENSDGQEKAR